jgi:hypothetical protein
MKLDIHLIILIGSVAIALLLADRLFRINPFLVSEGFQISGYPTRCGTDLPPCPHETRCMNGFCRGTDTPQLYDRNPLPVTP